jgi:hypothetical protein
MADNVGRVAVIVSRRSLLVVINLVPTVALIAVPDDSYCEPLQVVGFLNCPY